MQISLSKKLLSLKKTGTLDNGASFVQVFFHHIFRVGSDPPINRWLPEVEGDPMALAFAHESLKCAGLKLT